MATVLNVIIRDVEFGLTEDQIYKVPGNLFLHLLKSDPWVRQSKRLFFETHRESFPFIQRYLNGYNLFPISEEDARSCNLSRELLYRYLIEDANHFRLEGLAIQAKIDQLSWEVNKTSKVPASSATSESELYKIETQRLQYRLAKKTMDHELRLKELLVTAENRKLELQNEASNEKGKAQMEREIALLRLKLEQKKTFWKRFRSSGGPDAVADSTVRIDTVVEEMGNVPDRDSEAEDMPSTSTSNPAVAENSIQGPDTAPHAQVDSFAPREPPSQTTLARSSSCSVGMPADFFAVTERSGMHQTKYRSVRTSPDVETSRPADEWQAPVSPTQQEHATPSHCTSEVPQASTSQAVIPPVAQLLKRESIPQVDDPVGFDGYMSFISQRLDQQEAEAAQTQGVGPYGKMPFTESPEQMSEQESLHKPYIRKPVFRIARVRPARLRYEGTVSTSSLRYMTMAFADLTAFNRSATSQPGQRRERAFWRNEKRVAQEGKQLVATTFRSTRTRPRRFLR